MDDRSIQPTMITPRPAEYDRLVAELVDQLSFGPVAITTAYPGGLGFGKTTLARAVAQDPRVRSAFPDGVFWVSLAGCSGAGAPAPFAAGTAAAD